METGLRIEAHLDFVRLRAVDAKLVLDNVAVALVRIPRPDVPTVTRVATHVWVIAVSPWPGVISAISTLLRA